MKNLAIIGCGKVAHLHAKAIGNLANANLSAVWSRTPASAEKFAAEYDVIPCAVVCFYEKPARVEVGRYCNAA